MEILIADDQPEVRSALHLLLEQEVDQWRVAGEVTSLEELVKRLKVVHYDLVLLDWELPGFQNKETNILNGFQQQAIADLKTLWPDLKVVVLSGHPEARSLAFAAGADAFVSKGDPPDSLLSALSALRC